MLKVEIYRRGEKFIAFCVSVFFLLFYIFTQTSSIYGGDSGDLVVAAFTHGVAHPPGYPLYTFLGWLITHIPHQTVAWRMGLLSSIPSAMTLGIFFLILKKITKHTFVSLLTVCTLGFTYLYWLYAIVAEVFALNLFFVVLIFYLLLRFKETKNFKLLWWASFIFGLALTHHHTFLFLVPAYLFFIGKELAQLKHKLKIAVTCLLLFFLGLTPYFYVFWAARSGSPINWENPQNFHGFWRLITRAIYGTFRSGSTFGLSPQDRFGQLSLMNETFLIDFTRLGVGLGIVGMIASCLKDRKWFWIVLLFFLLSGPFFIFYAGFPVVLNFYLGVVERFLLVPYLFFSIWIAWGIKASVRLIDLLIRYIMKRPFPISVGFLFCLFPILLLYTNWPKIWPLKNDKTAENLAFDIFKTTPDNSLLFLSDDTSVFNTQYVYFTSGARNTWRGIRLIQFGTFGFGFYDQVITNYYRLDWNSDGRNNPFKDFVQQYYGQYPIMSGLRVDLGSDYTWVPVGLLYRLYKTQDLKLITPAVYAKQNQDLFSSYQDPLSGALGIYLHVMLADSIRVYANARREVGKILLKLGETKTSETYFGEAIRLQPEVIENQIDLGTALSIEKKCDEAERILQTALRNNPDYPATYQILTKVYKDCFKNDTKALEYVQKYEDILKKSQTPLSKF